MSKTKPLGLILPDWRIRAIGEGRCRRFTIPMEPQPEACVSRMVPAISGEHWIEQLPIDLTAIGGGRGEMNGRSIRCLKPGDVLFCKERWCKGNDEYGSPVIGYSDKTARYWGLDHRADVLLGECESDWSGDAIDGKWRSAETLPAWAARYRLRLTAVSAYRVREITHRQCVAEGWPGASELLYPRNHTSHYAGLTQGDWIEAIGDGDDACIEWFADQWDAQHPRYPFDTAWGFGCEFEMEER